MGFEKNITFFILETLYIIVVYMIIGDLVKQTQENLDQVGMNYGIGVVMEISNNSSGTPLAIVWCPKLLPQRSMRIRVSKLEVLRE